MKGSMSTRVGTAILVAAVGLAVGAAVAGPALTVASGADSGTEVIEFLRANQPALALGSSADGPVEDLTTR
jgi:hypothetical protein